MSIDAQLAGRPARIAIIVLFAAVFLHAVWPLHEATRAWNDFTWIYVAGRTWWTGFSPYDFPRFAAEWHRTAGTFSPGPPTLPFVYPPAWAVLAMPFSLLPLPMATRGWDAINILAFFGTCAVTISLLGKKELFQSPGIRLLVVFATVNGSLRYALWESQMSVVPTLALVACFWAWKHQRTGWLALFASVAALKPQIAALPLAFLLLNGGHAGILYGAAATILLSIAAIAPFGLTEFPAQLADCLARHVAAEFNQPIEFSNLTALWSNPIVGIVGLLLAAGWVAGLTLWRRKRAVPAADDTVWCLLLTVSAVPAFLPLHGYDLVVYTLVVIGAHVIRPRAIPVLIVLLVQAVGRVHVLEAAVGFRPLAPFFTLSIALLCLIAFRRTHGPLRSPAAPDLPPSNEATTPRRHGPLRAACRC